MGISLLACCSCYSVTQLCPTYWDSTWTAARQASLSFTISWSLTSSFPNLEPICLSLFDSNCCFLTYIQVFQEPGKVVICTLMLCQFIYPIDFLGSLIFLQVSYQLLQSRNYISSRVFWVMKLTKFQEPLSSKINKIVNIVLLIHKNEWNNAIYSTIDGHRDCHTVK